MDSAGFWALVQAAIPGVVAAGGVWGVMQYRVGQLETRRAEDRKVIDDHIAIANGGMQDLAVAKAEVASWNSRFDEFRREVREILSGIGERNEQRWNGIQSRIDDVFRKMGEG